MNQPEVKLLEWDSTFFGYRVGEINYTGSEPDLLAALHSAQSTGFKLIYLKSPTEIRLTSPLNHPYQIGVVDNKIIFQKNLAPNFANSLPAENIIRYTSPVVSPELIQLTLESGKYSRFALDPNFKHQEYDKLYTTWIRHSVSGEMADEVWVSTTPAGAITGLVTLRKNKDRASIGLLAVLPLFQRQGYGKKLLHIASQRTLDWGCTAIQVSTQQSNLPANSLYQNAGFKLHNQSFTYHLWL